MVVWVGLIIFIIFVKSIIGDLAENKKQKRFLVFTGVVIITIMGFRYPDYGDLYDVKVYYSYYRQIINTDWREVFEISRFEYGYVLLNKTLASIVPWPQFILIFEAAFCVFCVSRFIYRNSEYPFQSVIFYVTLGTMTFQLTAFRQSFALSICLLSIEYIKDKKFFKYIFMILLAMTFHKTAIVFLPFYFIANRKPNWINNILSVILMLVSISLTEVVTKVGNEFLDANYGGYRGNELGGLVPILIYTMTIILSFVFLKDIKNRLTLNMLIVALGLYLMRYKTQAIERISFYYTPALIVQLPNTINLITDKRIKQLINFTAILLAIVLFIYRTHTAEYGNYKFFWQ